jgi:PIN domain
LQNDVPDFLANPMATGIQKLLFVDTNIWLDFYRAQNEAYIGLLDKVVGIKAKVIVTHQLETEFKKNRQQVILGSITLLKSHIPKAVPSVGVLAQANQFKMVGKDIESAKKQIKKLQDDRPRQGQGGRVGDSEPRCRLRQHVRRYVVHQ